MGYYIRFLENKKSIPNWKVQYISTRKKDRKPDSIAKIKRTFLLIRNPLKLGIWVELTLTNRYQKSMENTHSTWTGNMPGNIG